MAESNLPSPDGQYSGLEDTNMPSGSSGWNLEADTDSKQRQHLRADRGSQRQTEADRGSQRQPEAARGSQRQPEADRGS